jgi:hypothetical protein
MMAAGLIKPSTGMVSFNGQSVLGLESKMHIGISAAKVALPGFFTVAELLTFHYVNNLPINLTGIPKWLTCPEYNPFATGLLRYVFAVQMNGITGLGSGSFAWINYLDIN